MEKRIKGNCLRYLIPFTVKDSFESACGKINAFHGKIAPRYAIDDGERLYTWKRVNEESGDNQKESDLYEYIRNEFSMSGTDADKNKMGCTWRLTCDNWKNQGKPEIPYEFLWFQEPFKKDSQELPAFWPLTFTEMGLYLFRNGLGFLWYEVNLGGQLQADELISFQNTFRELNRNNNVWMRTDKNAPISMKYHIHAKKPGIDPEVLNRYLVPFSVGNWVSELLSRFLEVSFISPRANCFVSNLKGQLKRTGGFGEITPDYEEFLSHEVTPELVPDKAILFTYLAFEPQEYGSACMIDEEKRDLVYHLTNGYKESYHYSPETGARMVQPFADALWYATKEGASYVVWSSEHSGTGKKDGNTAFFCGNFLDKIKGDYFHLFIRALYQSYSLLLYAGQMQKCLSAVNDLYMDINLFLTKNMATSVSHIHHQSDFYIYLMDCLHVHADIKSVTAGLSALDSLQRDQKEKEEHRREKEADDMEAKRDNRFQTIMSMLSVLAVISVFADLKDILNPTKDVIQSIVTVVGVDTAYLCLCIFIAIIFVAALWLAVLGFVRSFKRK